MYGLTHPEEGDQRGGNSVKLLSFSAESKQQILDDASFGECLLMIKFSNNEFFYYS